MTHQPPFMSDEFAAGVQMSFHNPESVKPRWSWRMLLPKRAIVSQVPRHMVETWLHDCGPVRRSVRRRHIPWTLWVVLGAAAAIAVIGRLI